jgi:hypothetical protein
LGLEGEYDCFFGFGEWKQGSHEREDEVAPIEPAGARRSTGVLRLGWWCGLSDGCPDLGLIRVLGFAFIDVARRRRDAIVICEDGHISVAVSWVRIEI